MRKKPFLKNDRNDHIVGAIFASAVLVLSPGLASAHVLTLEDSNSVVEIDPHSSSGLQTWQVDGEDHIAQQWLWYRIGDSAEQSIDSLSLATEGTLDTNFDTKDDLAFLRYVAPDFTLEVKYVLTGGAIDSKSSLVAEEIRIVNISNEALEFSLIQYNDYNLNGTPDNDLGLRPDEKTILQKDTSTGLSVAETVVTPAASSWEISTFSDLYDRLTDSDPTDLSNSGNGFLGDVVWGWQWDFTLAANGGTMLISKNRRIGVPEPTSIALLGLGLLGLGYASRRKASR